MMRWLLIFACACQGKPKKEEPPPPVVADTGGPSGSDRIDTWATACAAALSAKQTPVRKLTLIIDGCRPCGDWQPLLDWNSGAAEQAVLDAMEACNAYCSKDAKMHFAGALTDSRGKPTNKPWKVLGEKCKDAVSAVPDERFLSAPYFALDRIARAAAANPTLAPMLASLEVPLPALSITGIGFELPTSGVMKPEPPPLHVTVTANEIRIGMLPRAKLGANGVAVDHGTLPPYPGELVTVKDLATKLPPDRAVTIIAPAALPATRVAEVVAGLGTREAVLAVAATGAPKGWTLPGIVPVTLDAAPAQGSVAWALDATVDAQIADLAKKPAEAFVKPRVTIAKDATVAHLAKLLGALAFRDARSASLAKK